MSGKLTPDEAAKLVVVAGELARMAGQRAESRREGEMEEPDADTVDGWNSMLSDVTIFMVDSDHPDPTVEFQRRMLVERTALEAYRTNAPETDRLPERFLELPEITERFDRPTAQALVLCARDFVDLLRRAAIDEPMPQLHALFTAAADAAERASREVFEPLVPST